MSSAERTRGDHADAGDLASNLMSARRKAGGVAGLPTPAPSGAVPTRSAASRANVIMTLLSLCPIASPIQPAASLSRTKQTAAPSPHQTGCFFNDAMD
jgi:hypothetical protein